MSIRIIKMNPVSMDYKKKPDIVTDKKLWTSFK